MNYKSCFLLLIILAFFVTSSCKRNIQVGKESGIIEIRIDSLVDYGEKVNFSDLFSGFEIIPLEAKEGSYLSRIDNLYFINDTFFISDRFETKSVFLFSRKGEFINKIHRIGRGPGEYTTFADFYPDARSRSIQIFDWNSSKLIFYDFEGEYFHDITIDHRFSSFILDEDSYYFFRPFPDNPHDKPDEFLIYQYDIQGKELSKHYRYSNTTQGPLILEFNFGGNFFKGPDGVRFYRKYCDTIYTIGDGLKPFICLNTKKYRLSEEELTEMKEKYDYKSVHKMKKLFGVTQYSENENMAFFKFNIGFIEYNTFYYFDTGEIICTVILEDDLTYARPNLVTMVDDHLIGRLHPSQIATFKEQISEGKVELSEEERSKLLNLSDFSNPIIIFYKLKQQM